MEYSARGPEGAGVYSVEVLGVTPGPNGLVATCLRRSDDGVRKFTVVSDADGVRQGDEVLIPLPALRGQAWARPPRDYTIEALDGAVNTPAGRFDGCLVVAYLIAGGDAGCGRRYYAPGVGFVHESCSDETEPFELSLTAVRP